MSNSCTIIHAKTPNDILIDEKNDDIVIGYWDICGLGQCPRYALEIAGACYTDVRIDPGMANSSDYKQVWFKKKNELLGEKTMAFPNLPYLVDGNVLLSQSNTILRYIARKFGLQGNAYNAHLFDLVLDQASDLDNTVTMACYMDLNRLQKDFPDLERWEKFLGKKMFMTGDRITVADLKIYEVLRKLKILAKEPGFDRRGFLEKQYPKLAAFVNRVEALPAIHAYQSSDRFIDRPLNNPHAKFR